MKILRLARNILLDEVLEWLGPCDNIEVTGVFGAEVIKKRVNEYGLKYYGNDLLEHEELSDIVDLVVSWQYGKLIKEPFISTPRLGCINFHPAPLPKYKGRGGCNLAILNHEKKWGGTVHYVNENYDEGDIIEVRFFDFDYKNETGYSLKVKTNDTMFELFKDTLSCFAKNNCRMNSYPQTGEGMFWSKEEMLETMKIKDSDSVDIINDKIRAFWFPTYDGAYVEIKGERFTLVNESIIKSLDYGLDKC